MATPAAVLSIVVEANTGKAQAAIKKFENDLKKVDREKADATLGADVDQGGFDVHSALLKKVAASRANAKLGADVNEGDFAKAHAMVSALGARDVDVDVDIDRGMLSRIKAVSTALTGLGGAAGGAGGDVGGLGLKLGGLGGSLGAMAPLAIAAAVAVGVLAAAIAALTASLGAAIAGLGALAIGAMGAMTVGFGGIAAIAAPAISSLTELMGAQEAANKAQKTGAASAAATAASSAQAVKAAHEQVADATRGVTAAEEQLANTQRSVKIAQESLTQARFDATRQLQDMRRAALESDTSEARARISLQQAQASLREMMREGTASALDIRSAELSVTEARENLRDVTISGNRAQADYTKAQKGGISQMPGVVSAQQSLQDALRSVKSAQVGVADAHRGVSRALDNLANQQRQANAAMGAGATQMAALELAAKKAGPAAVAFSHQIKQLGNHWKNLTKGGRADFFGMLSDGVDRLRNKLPFLAKSANKSMRALRGGFDDFLDRATGPEFRKFVNVMTRTFSKSIGPFSRAFGNIAKILQRIAVAVAPFVIKMAKAFERITKGWLQGTKDGKKLRQTIGGLLSHLGAWLKLGTEIGKVFLNLFKALAGDGKGLVKWLTKGAEMLNKWLTSAEGKEQMKEFMAALIPLFKELAKLSFLLLRAFLLLLQAAAIVLVPALKVVNWILEKILSLNVDPLMVLAPVFWQISKAADAAAAAFKWVKNALGNVVEFIADKWGPIGHVLGAPFRFAWGIIKDIFGFIRDKVGAVIDYIRDKWPYIRQVLVGPFRAVGNVVRDVFGFIKDRVGDVVGWVGDKWSKLGDILKKPFKGIADFVKNAFNGVKGFVIGIINDLIAAFNSVFDREIDPPGPGPKFGGIHIDPIGGGGGTASRRQRRGVTRGIDVGGQLGGLVTASGIVPLGFQHGGMVGKRGLKPGSKDTVPAMLEVGELVIPKKMVDATKKNAKLTANAMTGELGKGHKEASKDTEKFVKRHGKEWEKLRFDTSKTTTRFRKGTIDDFQKTSKEGDQATSKMRERVSEGFSKMRGNAMESSGKMKSGVGEDFRDLTGAVRDGLQRIGQMTNSALRALGVKKVNFSIGVKGKQRGGLIPGTGDGDKVPVMAEPGEGFINKKAVQAMGGGKAIDRINSAVPRFQKGGTVKGGMAAMIAEANKFEQRQFPYVWGGGHSGFGIQPVDCSGAVSDILHAAGLLKAPMVSGDLAHWGKPGKGPLTVYANPAHTFMSLAGRFFGTSSSNPDGGAGWFSDPGSGYTSGFAARTMDVAGAMAKMVKRVLLEGPEGPMQGIGQASLDRARKAANKYIKDKTPGGMFGGGQALNDIKGALSKRQISSVWRMANRGQGNPGLMAAIALAESSGNPRAVGHDPGGTEGLGLWQITTGYNDDLIARYGGRAGMFKPLNNAQAAGDLLARQGLGAWVQYNNGAYQAFMKRGGMVPYVGSFDKGGTVARDGLGMLHKGEHVDPPGGHGRSSPFRHYNLMIKWLTRIAKSTQRHLETQLSQRQREKKRKLEKIDPEDLTKHQKQALRRLRELSKEHAKLTKDERVERVKLKRHLATYGKDMEKMKTMFAEDGKLTQKERKRLHAFREKHEDERERLHDLNQQQHLHRREKRLDRRLGHRLDTLRGDTSEQRLLIAELKELRKDIREHNRLWRSVKGANKEAVHSVVDLVANGIGAKGLQKTRLAGWGVDRRY